MPAGGLFGGDSSGGAIIGAAPAHSGNSSQQPQMAGGGVDIAGSGLVGGAAPGSPSKGVDNADDKTRLTALYSTHAPANVPKIDGVLAKRTT